MSTNVVLRVLRDNMEILPQDSAKFVTLFVKHVLDGIICSVKAVPEPINFSTERSVWNRVLQEIGMITMFAKVAIVFVQFATVPIQHNAQNVIHSILCI